MQEIIVAVNRLSDKIIELSAKVDFLSKSPSQQLTRKYLDNEAAAKILQVSKRTLAKMRAEGLIKYIKIRRRIVYQASDLHEYLESHYK